MLVDDRQVLGASTWLKPAKFAISMALRFEVGLHQGAQGYAPNSASCPTAVAALAPTPNVQSFASE